MESIAMEIFLKKNRGKPVSCIIQYISRHRRTLFILYRVFVGLQRYPCQMQVSHSFLIHKIAFRFIETAHVIMFVR